MHELWYFTIISAAMHLTLIYGMYDTFSFKICPSLAKIITTQFLGNSRQDKWDLFLGQFEITFRDNFDPFDAPRIHYFDNLNHFTYAYSITARLTSALTCTCLYISDVTTSSALSKW